MFDPDKPVQTRDGRKARIICTDRKGAERPIIALVERVSAEEMHTYSEEGAWSYLDECGLDLINIPDTKYLNVFEYLNGDLGAFYCDTKQEAESYAINARTCGAKVLLEAHPIEV